MSAAPLHPYVVEVEHVVRYIVPISCPNPSAAEGFVHGLSSAQLHVHGYVLRTHPEATRILKVYDSSGDET